MDVIIIGSDVVGRSIAQYLLLEDHDVVMVDDNPENLAETSENLDVQTVLGLGSRPSVLEAAGAADADMLIAVTTSDEVNMMACQMAYSLYDVPKKIARVRDASYLDLTGSHVYTPDNMPVDVIISPEKEVADAILRTLFVPGAFDAFGFDDGHVQLVGTHVTKQAALLKKTLKNWHLEGMSMYILSINRGDRLMMPSKNDHLEEGDEIYFLCRKADIEDCMALLGHEGKKATNVFLVGGGHVGLNICQSLEKMNISARVLERSMGRAGFLAEVLNKTIVLQGDALNRTLLEQENIAETDAFLSVTSSDNANILSSILALQLGVENIMTLLNQSDIIPIAEGVGLDKVISPQQITVSRILQHMRQGQVLAVHNVYGGSAEVIELRVGANSGLLDVRLQDLTLPRNSRLGALVKADGRVEMNAPDAILQEGDRVIVFAFVESIHQLEKLF